MTSESGDEGFGEGYDNISAGSKANIVNEEKGAYRNGTPSEDHGIDGTVDKNDLNRLLKKGVDSDKFKVFKAVALRHPRPVEVSAIVEEALGGEWWRIIDAYRILQNARELREPLVETAGDFDKQDEDTFFQLTEYGEKVWKTLMINTTRESKRLQTKTQNHPQSHNHHQWRRS